VAIPDVTSGAVAVFPPANGDRREQILLGDGRVAWFSDSDGNTFAIEEGSAR
jgi:hypothetical protein